MSSLDAVSCAKLEDILEMHNGYVLGFSNKGFQDFMLKLVGIDVMESDGYKSEPSKAKKLRYFIKNESDMTVGAVLREMMKLRQSGIERRKLVDDDFVDEFAGDVKELEAIINAMCTGSVLHSTTQERTNALMLSGAKVLEDLISVAGTISTNKTMGHYSLNENDVTDCIRDLLIAKGYTETRDQTHHGLSDSGKGAGELDILLCENGKEIALIEALKLTSVVQATISSHIDKAVTNYNQQGTPTFIIAYVGAPDFNDFWKRYFRYISNYQYKIDVKTTMEEVYIQNAAIKGSSILLSKDVYDFPLYFLAIKMIK